MNCLDRATRGAERREEARFSEPASKVVIWPQYSRDDRQQFRVYLPRLWNPIHVDENLRQIESALQRPEMILATDASTCGQSLSIELLRLG